MLVVVAPIKFHIPCVNIAGIHYRINSIGIESLLLKPWVELLQKFPKYQTGISINLFFKTIRTRLWIFLAIGMRFK